MLREALEQVLRRMRQAGLRAGRDPSSIRLVAVTKTVPSERVRRLVECGQLLLGENRVQEALDKIPQVGPPAIWHLVGHLQRNKVRQAVGRFELLHGVDSERLALEIDRRAGEAGIRQPVLIQVNLSGESTKFGVHEAGLPGLLEALAPMGHLELRGLMTIPPPVERAADARRWFRRLRELRDQAVGRVGLPLPDLSMGMTDDFEVAVEEGATLVRVGRAIFGERPA